MGDLLHVSVSSPTHVDSTVGLDADQVVDRVSKTLFSAKMLLGRLHGHVAQQELNLAQLPSGIAAQAGTSPSKVVRCELINSRFLGAVLHDVPHYPLRHTISPGLARATNAPKHATSTQFCRRKPRVDGAFNPVRYRHRPNMSGLADQINDRPMILPALKMSDIQLRRLFSAQTATQEEPEQCSVSLAFQRIRVRHLPEGSCLVDGEPVAKSDAEILWPLNPTDAGSEIRAEQTGIGGFIRATSDRRKPPIDCARRKLTRLQMNSVTSYDGLVEGQSGHRAVPRNELVYGVPVTSLGFLRGQAIEDRPISPGQDRAGSGYVSEKISLVGSLCHAS